MSDNNKTLNKRQFRARQNREAKQQSALSNRSTEPKLPSFWSQFVALIKTLLPALYEKLFTKITFWIGTACLSIILWLVNFFFLNPCVTVTISGYVFERNDPSVKVATAVIMEEPSLTVYSDSTGHFEFKFRTRLKTEKFYIRAGEYPHLTLRKKVEMPKRPSLSRTTSLDLELRFDVEDNSVVLD